MTTPLLEHKEQIAFVVETTEGTAMTVAATNAKMLCYEGNFSDQVEMQERNPARSTLTRLQRIAGKEIGEISWKTELKGSGAVGTRPSWDSALRACGFTSAAVAAVTVTGMTGTFQPTESFTVTGTSQTGRVVGMHNGLTRLHFVATSGTLASGMTVVGNVSSAQCICSATMQTGQGWEYLPASSGVPSGTVALYKDGTRHLIYGARGNVSLECRVGELPMLSFSFQGVVNTTSGTTDATLFTDAAIGYESTVPVAFKGSTCKVDSYAAIFASLTVEMGNTLAQREDASATAGVLSYLITERAPQINVDPEATLKATHDWYGRLHAGSLGWFAASIGSAVANQIRLGSRGVQHASIGQGDRSGLTVYNSVYDLVASAVTSGDLELQVAMI